MMWITLCSRGMLPVSFIVTIMSLYFPGFVASSFLIAQLLGWRFPRSPWNNKLELRYFLHQPRNRYQSWFCCFSNNRVCLDIFALTRLQPNFQRGRCRLELRISSRCHCRKNRILNCSLCQQMRRSSF